MNVLYQLEPEKEYCVSVEQGEEKAEISFCTEAQDYTVNVRDLEPEAMAYKMILCISRQPFMAMSERQSCADPGRRIPDYKFVLKKIILHWNWQKVQCFLQIHNVKNFRS